MMSMKNSDYIQVVYILVLETHCSLCKTVIFIIANSQQDVYNSHSELDFNAFTPSDGFSVISNNYGTLNAAASIGGIICFNFVNMFVHDSARSLMRKSSLLVCDCW